MTSDGKECRECGCFLPLAEFPNSARAKDGKAHTCKRCKSALLARKRRPNVLALTPAQERDARYVKLLMQHGYSSASFYLRMKQSVGADEAVALAEAAFSDNGRYWRLRRQIGVRWRTR